MEEQTTVEHAPIQPEPAVGFPDPRPSRQSSSSFPKWIFAVIGLVVILAAGGFFLYQSSTSTTTNPTPSPFVSGLDVLPTPTETPMTTVTPVASATPSSTPSSTQKSTVSIEIQNGTGTTGDAAVAKSLLEKAGYTKLSTGNADSQTATGTTVQYSSDVPSAIVSDIVKALSDRFGTATATAGLTGKMSVRVITGPKQASTATTAPKMSATPTASPKATSTTKPTTTPTATPKATP